MKVQNETDINKNLLILYNDNRIREFDFINITDIIIEQHESVLIIGSDKDKFTIVSNSTYNHNNFHTYIFKGKLVHNFKLIDLYNILKEEFNKQKQEYVKKYIYTTEN